jgi:hypothetical protein
MGHGCTAEDDRHVPKRKFARDHALLRNGHSADVDAPRVSRKA